MQKYLHKILFALIVILLLMTGLWYVLGSKTVLEWSFNKVQNMALEQGLIIGVDNIDGHLLHGLQFEKLRVSGQEGLSAIDIDYIRIDYLPYSLLDGMLNIQNLQFSKVAVDIAADSTDTIWKLISEPNQEEMQLDFAVKNLEVAESKLSLSKNNERITFDKLQIKANVEQQNTLGVLFEYLFTEIYLDSPRLAEPVVYSLSLQAKLAEERFLQLKFAKTGLDSDTSAFTFSLPRRIHAQLNKLNAVGEYEFALGAQAASSTLQSRIHFIWEQNAPFNQMEFLESSFLMWQNPLYSLSPNFLDQQDFQLESIELTLDQAFHTELSDSLKFSLFINNLESEANGLAETNLRLRNVINTSFNQGQHQLLLKNAADSIRFNLHSKINEKSYDFELKASKGQLSVADWWNVHPNDAIGSLVLEHILFEYRLSYQSVDGFFEGFLDLRSNSGEILDVNVQDFSLSGPFSAISANLELNLETEAGKLEGQLFGVQLEESVEHEFLLKLENINIGPFIGKPTFTTSFNANGKVTGSGKNPFDTQSAINFSFGNSEIVGAQIDTARLEASLRRGKLIIDQLKLRSELADGLLNAEIDLRQPFYPANQLEGFFEIKDISSLSPLFNLDTLNASGVLSSKINPNVDGKVYAFSSIALNDIQLGSDKRIGSVEGLINIPMEENPEFVSSLQIREAQIQALTLTSFEVMSNLRLFSENIEGDLRISFDNQNKAGADFYSHLLWSDKELLLDVDKLAFRHGQDTLKNRHPFDIRFRDDSFTISRLALKNPVTSTQVDINYSQTPDTLYGQLKSYEFDLYKAQQCFLSEEYGKGIITSDLQLNGNPNDWALDGNVELVNVSFDEFKLPRMQSNISGTKRGFEVDAKLYSNSNNQKSSVYLQASIPNIFDESQILQDSSSYFKVTLPRQELQALNGFTTSDWLLPKAMFEGSADISNGWSNPKISMILQATEFETPTIPKEDTLSFTLHRKMNQPDIKIQAEKRRGSVKDVQINLSLPFAGLDTQANQFWINMDDRISGDIRTKDLKLSSLNPPRKLKDGIWFNNGFINTNINIRGSLKAPLLNGNVYSDLVSFDLPAYGVQVKEGILNARLDQNALTLEEMRFKDDTGSFNVEGNWALNTSTKNQLNISLSRFQLMNNADARFYGDGKIALLSESPNRLNLKGSLSIDNGTILVDAFEEDNIEEIQLEDSMKVGSTWSAEQDIFLDLRLSLGNNLSIKNQAQPRLDLKPTGTIELTGKLDADTLQAFGSIQTTRGTLDVIGKRFNIEQASTLFDGNLMNPELKIIASYRVPRPHEVDIRHIITGRLQNPQFEYQSDPPMELQNIISYVLFNKPYYALDGWQQTLAGANGNTGGAATDIALQLLANRVERIASQRLGIDVVQIDNSRSGSNNATTLKTGWYLSEKTFFAILNELGVTNPQTQFLLEYYINQNLNLVITQDVEDGTRFDLRWQYDY